MILIKIEFISQQFLIGVVFMAHAEDKLLDLLANNDQPVSGKDLGRILNLSSRTIRNYVKRINVDEKIIQSSRDGYTLIKRDNNRTTDIPNNDKERFSLILKYLINNQQIDVFNFCDSNFISYSTLQRTISYGNQQLGQWDLRIAINHQRLVLIGNEQNKRNFFVHLLYQENLNAFIGGNDLGNIFGQDKVIQVENILDKNLHNFKIDLNTFAYDNLLLYLLLIINRSANHNSKEKEALKIIPCCEFIIKELDSQFNVKIQYSDQAFINSILENNLKQAHTLTQKNSTDDKIEKIINKIEQHYSVNLHKKEFMIPFSLHISKLISRSQKKQIIRNPFTNDFKNKMPFVFDMASYAANLIRKEWNININQDEIAFLAMHLSSAIRQNQDEAMKLSSILIVPDYLDLAANTQKYLETNFPAINLMHIITPNQVQQYDLSNYDVIFNTGYKLHKRDNEININIADYSENNIQTENRLHQLLITKKIKLLKPIINKQFPSQLYWKLPNNKKYNYLNALKIATDEMIKLPGVDKNLYNNLLQREKLSSTAFNNIAVSHPINYTSEQTYAAIVVSKNPIDWLGNKVNIAFIVSIAKQDKATFKELYELIIELLEDNKEQNKLIKCTNMQDFINTLFNGD